MECHEFIAGTETWGSGGQMFDIVTLKNGSVLMIGHASLVIYDTRSDFDAGRAGTTLSYADALRTTAP